MMGNIVKLRDNKRQFFDELLQYLRDKQEEDPLAVIVLVLNKDDSMEFVHSPDCYLGKLGMLENAKHDLFAQANDLT